MDVGKDPEPPPSPTPGWANGEVCIEMTATRFI